MPDPSPLADGADSPLNSHADQPHANQSHNFATDSPPTMSNNTVLPSAEEAIRSAQRLTHAALESLSDGMRELADSGKPLVDDASHQASRFAQRSREALHDSTRHLQDQAQHATDSTLHYIRKEPVRAILIAAASGAALMALMSALSGSRGRH